MPASEDAPREAELVERLRARDDAAVETLLGRFQTRVFGLSLRLTGNRQDAEEVAQDVFWQVLRHIDTFRGDAKLSSWIYRITTNTALMKLRKRVHTQELPDDDALSPSMTPEGMIAEPVVDWARLPHEEAERKELASRLAAAIDELPPDYRAVVVLRDVEGLSAAEACDALQLGLPALKSRLHRARLFLRRRLTEYMTARHPGLTATMPPMQRSRDDASLP